MKDYQQCCDEVAKKYKFDDFASLLRRCLQCEWKNFLSDFQKEAAQLYASECVKEAVKLARTELVDDGVLLIPALVKYTEQEILSNLNLNLYRQ